MKNFVSLVLLLCAGIPVCRGADDLPRDETTRAVRSLMGVYEEGQAFKSYLVALPDLWMTGGGIIHGTHRNITAKELVLQAHALTVYGRPAVPELVCWVEHEDPGVRFLAAEALNQISGQNPPFPFKRRGALTENEKGVAAAKAVWLRWYESEAPQTPS